jgi:hypothetical protein
VARWGVGVAAPRGRVDVEHWSLASGRDGCWLATGEVGGWRGGEGSGRGGWRGGQVAREAAGGLGLGFRPTALRDSGSAGCGRVERTADCVCVLRSAACCTAVRRLICIRDLGLAPACGLRKSGPSGRWRAPRCRVNYIGLSGSGSRAVNGPGRVVLGFLGRTGQPAG